MEVAGGVVAEVDEDVVDGELDGSVIVDGGLATGEVA